MVTAQASLLVDRGATFSPCRRYRYSLFRRWAWSGSACCFVGANPSVAGEENNDPTIRKEIGFAKRWGFSVLVKVNMFAFVSTDPRRLLDAEDPIGPENDAAIADAVLPAMRVVLCWGSHAPLRKLLVSRAKRVIEIIQSCIGAREVVHFGLCQDGQPKHPLYLPYTSELRKWEAP